MFKLLEPEVEKRLSAKDALNEKVCPSNTIIHSNMFIQKNLLIQWLKEETPASEEPNLKLTNAFMNKFRNRARQFKMFMGEKCTVM